MTARAAWSMAAVTILVAGHYTLDQLGLAPVILTLLRFGLNALCVIFIAKLLSAQPE